MIKTTIYLDLEQIEKIDAIVNVRDAARLDRRAISSRSEVVRDFVTDGLSRIASLRRLEELAAESACRRRRGEPDETGVEVGA